MKKRFFAILLCLVMIVGLLPTGALAAQTADSYVFTKTDKLEAGKTYLIVSPADESGKVVALTNNNGKAATAEVEINNDTITVSDSNAFWVSEANGDRFNLKNDEYYAECYHTALGLYKALYNAGRGWAYADGLLTHTGSDTESVYTLYYSSSQSTFATKKDDTRQVFLYAYDGVIEPAACEHKNVTPTAAKNATCTEPGNIAYWYCADCETYFSDEALTTEIAERKVLL